MNLLITGSSGFIGTNYIRSSRKHNISEIDLLTININAVGFKNIDTVLHLAALAHKKNRISESQYLAVNRDMAYNFAKLAKKNGVKQFILMSTAKVYGEMTVEGESWDEDSECNPVDYYGISKLEAEKLILSLNDENFKVGIIRSPVVYGPGVKANILNIIRLVDNLPFIPLGGIENKRSFVHIGNLIELIDKIISLNTSGIFIAGDKSPITTTCLIHHISNSLGRKKIIFRLPNILRTFLRFVKPGIYNRLFNSFYVDNTNTNNRLSFTPLYSIEEGIRDTVDWYVQSKNKKEE